MIFSKSYLYTGKFAQKNIQTHSKCFKACQVDKWIMLFEDERLIVTQVIPITQDVVRYGCYKKDGVTVIFRFE